MGFTPYMALPYPDGAIGVAIDPPSEFKALALAVEAGLTAGYRGISDWSDYDPAPSGIVGSANAAPGWVVAEAKMRYRAGRIQLRGMLYLNGGGAAFGQQVYLGHPIAALIENSGWGISGRVSALHASQSYDFVPLGQSTSQWTFGTRAANGLVAPNGPSSPFAWTQSDQLSWNIDYDFQN